MPGDGCRRVWSTAARSHFRPAKTDIAREQERAAPSTDSAVSGRLDLPREFRGLVLLRHQQASPDLYPLRQGDQVSRPGRPQSITIRIAKRLEYRYAPVAQSG